MENNENNQSLNYANSLYDNLENSSKNGVGMHNMENYIEELQNNFQQETLNIYTYYTNIKEVIDNLIQEFPMIDISSKNIKKFTLIYLKKISTISLQSAKNSSNS